MKVILIDDLPFEITFNPVPIEIEPVDSTNPRQFGGSTGSVDLLLECSTPARMGQGVDSDNSFPWRYVDLQKNPGSSARTRQLAPEPGRFRFSISFEVLYHPSDGDLVTIQVKGDFLEVLQYVFKNIPATLTIDNANLKLNFEGSLKFRWGYQGVDEKCIRDPIKLPSIVMLLKKDGSGIFEHSGKITPARAFRLATSLNTIMILEMTVELFCMDPFDYVEPPASEGCWAVAVPTAASSNYADLETETRETNKKMLEEKLLSDYDLVAQSGKPFPCNKLILAARSFFFKASFQFQSQKGTSKKLNISERGVEALLQYLYYSCSEIPDDSPVVAQELLEVSRELMIPTLEKAMKRLFLMKPDDWLDFEEALALFRYSSKLGEYEDVKRKAVKAMKLEPDQSKKSEFFKQLCTTDSETAANLLSFCFI